MNSGDNEPCPHATNESSVFWRQISEQDKSVVTKKITNIILDSVLIFFCVFLLVIISRYNFNYSKISIYIIPIYYVCVGIIIIIIFFILSKICKYWLPNRIINITDESDFFTK